MAKEDKDERLFAPFDIGMDEHAKIICLSDEAFRALFEAVFYSRRNMTDGFLDERVVKKKWGVEAARELSTNDPEKPSWIQIEGGWAIHDFAKHHPLRAEIEAKRANLSSKRAEAGRKGAASRWQNDGKGVANDGSQSESESESESETETRLTPTESVSLGSNGAVDNLTDSEKESVEAANRLAAPHGYDLNGIVQEIRDQCGRDASHGQALVVAHHIIGKCRSPVKSPQRYILSSIRKSPLEVQQWIDREVTS